jgi:hypothetical protein
VCRVREGALKPTTASGLRWAVAARRWAGGGDLAGTRRGSAAVACRWRGFAARPAGADLPAGSAPGWARRQAGGAGLAGGRRGYSGGGGCRAPALLLAGVGSAGAVLRGAATAGPDRPGHPGGSPLRLCCCLGIIMVVGPGGLWCLQRRHGGASGCTKLLRVAVLRRWWASTLSTSGRWELCNQAKAFTIVGGHDGGGFRASTSLLGDIMVRHLALTARGYHGENLAHLDVRRRRFGVVTFLEASYLVTCVRASGAGGAAACVFGPSCYLGA